MYMLKEERQLRPQTLMHLVSNLLYEKRFGPYYCEPVIAGLDPVTGQPYVCATDLIGCPNEPGNFVVSGTASEQLYGMCESLWQPDMVMKTAKGSLAALEVLMMQDKDALFETISQALLNAADRDAISGWGGVVHIMYVVFAAVRYTNSNRNAHGSVRNTASRQRMFAAVWIKETSRIKRRRSGS